jgi:hypothetical protein
MAQPERFVSILSRHGVIRQLDALLELAESERQGLVLGNNIDVGAVSVGFSIKEDVAGSSIHLPSTTFPGTSSFSLLGIHAEGHGRTFIVP